MKARETTVKKLHTIVGKTVFAFFATGWLIIIAATIVQLGVVIYLVAAFLMGAEVPPQPSTRDVVIMALKGLAIPAATLALYGIAYVVAHEIDRRRRVTEQTQRDLDDL